MIRLALKSITSPGDLSRERIVLRAIEDCDIGAYAIFATRRGSTVKTIEAGPIANCFWLPDKQVHKDDLIVLYTKEGAASVKQNPSGATSHFFYWDLRTAVWRDDRVAVLVQIGKEWNELAVTEEEAIEEIPPSVGSNA